MPNIEAQPEWVNVREIGIELARGGPDGNMNEQAKALVARTELLKEEKANKTDIVQGQYRFATLALFNEKKATIPLNSTVIIDEAGDNQGANTWDGSTLKKSSYDPLQNSKNYTDENISKRTLQQSNISKDELAIFTDKNGRRTWIEVGKDGLPTERTNEIIKKAVIQDVNTTHLIFVVVDKNGRLISGIDKFGNQVNYSQKIDTSYISATVDKKGRLISGIDKFGNQVNYSQKIDTSYISATVDKNGRLISGIDKFGATYPKPSVSSIKNKKIKILGIGNSFTEDAFMYVPWLLKELGITDFTIAVLYFGGCTLQQHYNFAINDQAVYGLEVYDTDAADYWINKGVRTLKQAINYTDFDTITLQQQSAASRDYGTYTPYLNPLINYIFSNTNYPTRLGWLGIPSAPDGNRGGNWNADNLTSAQFYELQQQNFQNVLADTPIEYVIPDGTAVQNLRGTSLKNLGEAGNTTQEGLHLNEGIPCLVASYAVVLKLLEIFKLQGSVFGSRILPTAEWIVDKNIQGPNGTPTDVTLDNIIIAQKCAIAAVKTPYQTSVINY